MTKAKILEDAFNNTNRTMNDMGAFKLRVWFSGVASDDGEKITFKDGSVAEFLNRDSLSDCRFKALRD